MTKDEFEKIIKEQSLTLEEKSMLLLCVLIKNQSGIFYKGDLYRVCMDQKGTIDRVFASLQKKGVIISKVKNDKENKGMPSWDHEMNIDFSNPFDINNFRKKEHKKELKFNQLQYDSNTTNVYVMIDEYTGLFKIGRSVNPLKRESTFLSQSPSIKLLFYFKTRFSTETILHKLFESKRVRGEWFRLTKEDLQYIKQYESEK